MIRIYWDTETNPDDCGWAWTDGDVVRALTGDVGRDRDADVDELMDEVACDPFYDEERGPFRIER